MKTSDLISKILDVAYERLNIHEPKYITITFYDCCGLWQVWLSINKFDRVCSDIYIDSDVCQEEDELDDALQVMLQKLSDDSINVQIKDY